MSKTVLKYTAFPNLMVPDEEKATLEYGLSWAKAIEYEWFYRPDGGGSLGPYYDKRQRYNQLRLYGRGEQSTDGYARLLGIDKGDFNYTNYDLRPIQVIPKFVKLLSNQMSERLFEVTAEATDKFSTDLKSKQKETLERLKISKKLLVEAKDLLGVDLLPEEGEDGIPNTQEEIDLHMKLKYKPNVEIATEEAIKYTLDYNDYEETQSKVVEDLVVIGIGAVKTSTDPNKGIVVEYVDPAEMVYSYPVHRDHRDVYYWGQMKRMTVTEAKRISNGQITDEDLKKSAQQTSQWAVYNGYSNERYYREEDFEGTMVDILHFTYKTLHTETYKKKPNKNGGFKLTKKESTFQKPEGDEGDYEVIKKDIEVWYKGSVILGTDLIFNYGLCENMVRPKAHLNKTYPMYTVYAPDLYQGREKSLVSTIIPYVDQMQQIHIKLQQLIAKARPNGIWIDVNGLTEIPMGDGGKMDVMEIIKLYNETGNVLGSSESFDGDYNIGKDPIRELKNGVVDGLDRMIGAYNHYMNLVRDAIGIPVGVDASTPHPDQAVGVQEQLALNSNTATRHILESTLNITKGVCRSLSLRFNDLFKDDNLREVYERALGSINIEFLKSIREYPLEELGIIIQLKPDASEKQRLEENLQVALSNGLIELDDAIDIRGISNIKVANQLIKIRRVKRDKEKFEKEKEMVQVNADANAQAAERTAQANSQEIAMKSESELAVVQAKSQARIAELEQEAKLKEQLMGSQFNYDFQLKQLEISGKAGDEQLKEKGKLDRQNTNNTQASAMITQRQKDSAPMNFESSEETISESIDRGQVGLT